MIYVRAYVYCMLAKAHGIAHSFYLQLFAKFVGVSLLLLSPALCCRLPELACHIETICRVTNEGVHCPLRLQSCVSHTVNNRAFSPLCLLLYHSTVYPSLKNHQARRS